MRLLFSLLLAAVIGMPAFADDILRFQVDPAWPKPLPNDWIMGQAAGVAVDAQGHIWVNANTGAYKRHWGAYGKKPTDEKLPYSPAAAPSPQFGNPVHRGHSC